MPEHDHPTERGGVGLTTEDNLGSMCQRAHDSKTHGGWHLAQPEPGSFVWTSPTGRVYRRRARPGLPGWRHRRSARPPPVEDRAPG